MKLGTNFEDLTNWAGILSAAIALIAVLQASWLSFKANQPAVDLAA